ncbi:UNVERIFIED_CONTAM: hypothetical protein Sradi_5621400 [Sesamum radiatum]|uniref:Uncharacterized protein n=1 Tax=Sesamum radiatum TaxID=300843 RepID=A0AAW2L2L5_SESRA
MANKWAVPGTIAPQVRSSRKTNNDQVAIAIDVDDNKDRMEDDDDDKAHGFKSLTTSKIVPRFTRPVSDMVDGLWSSDPVMSLTASVVPEMTFTSIKTYNHHIGGFIHLIIREPGNCDFLAFMTNRR